MELPKKKGARLESLLFLLLANSAVLLVIADQRESSSVPLDRFWRQEEDLPDDKINGRVIKLKRQDYNSRNGVLGSQKPLIVAISSPNLKVDEGRIQITQEEHIEFDAPEKIRTLGYEVSTHTVETEDGYLLTIFRLRNPNCTSNGRPPIFFQHGVLDSADTWFVLDGDRGAPYQAANYHYDVWIGNARGNHYSNKHRTLSQKDPRYWNFSWHEMGTKDLPAVFTYILGQTKETNKAEKISYVGHSMGTTMFYVLLSELPEWNEKISLSVLLPPSAFLSHTTSPLRYLKPYTNLYNSVLADGPFLPSEINHLLASVFIPFCPFNVSIGSIRNESACNALVYFAQGSSKEDTNGTILQRVFGHFPSTTSKKLIAHFLQLVGEERFTKFDFGSPKENFKRYGQTYPPEYNLYNVDTVSFSYYGQLDVLIDYKDVEENLRLLGTTKTKYNVLIMDYSHLDFIWGNSASPAITSRFLQAFEDFYKRFGNMDDPTPPPPLKSSNNMESDRLKNNNLNNADVDRSCTCACDADDLCHEDFDDEDENRSFLRAGQDYTFTGDDY